MKFAIGTVQFGLNYGVANRAGQTSATEAQSILDLARQRGVDTLDTARAYGESERRLGAIGVNDWKVVSKLSAVPDGVRSIPEWIAGEVRASLADLQIPKLHGLLLHRPHQLLESGGPAIYRALQEVREAGLVEKIGISIYGPEELDLVLPKYQFDVIQAPFNLLDRRLIDTGWLARFSQHGTELHVRSIFLQGVLLMNSQERMAKFGKWSGLWKRYEEWLAEAGLSPLDACVRHALQFPEIAKVVIGVDSVSHLSAILDSADGPAPAIPADLQSRDEELINPARW